MTYLVTMKKDKIIYNEKDFIKQFLTLQKKLKVEIMEDIEIKKEKPNLSNFDSFK